MRPKSKHPDLPIGMTRKTGVNKRGKEWVAYYYTRKRVNGKRVVVALGNDLHEAKRKWAELEKPTQPVADINLMRFVFDRYEREIIPTKAISTQKGNRLELLELRRVFDGANIDAIEPKHVRQYLDKRSAKTRANREIALFSHVFNHAREWGYTAKENPCRGVKKNRETPSTVYVSDEDFNKVWECANSILRDAMDLAYLTGQRRGDVLKMTRRDIQDGALLVDQGKTGKKLRILIEGELKAVLDRITARPVTGIALLTDDKGQRLTATKLRRMFEDARAKAGVSFTFRDLRPKAASDIADIGNASKLLGHTNESITKFVYRRVGETVKPVR